MASIDVRLTEAGIRRPGVGYTVQATLSIKARIVIPGLADDADLEEDLPRRGRPRGPRTNVTFQAALAGRASGTSDAEGRITLRIDTRAAEERLLGNLDQIPGASGAIIEHRTVLRVRQPSGALLIHENRRQRSSSFRFNLRVPRRRVVILDIDGLRWDVFYKHLKRVRDAGAGLSRRYRFEPRPDATDDTVIDDGKDLRSGLAFLCFGSENSMVDVRLARAPYPSFTFPSHATMFTGVWPGRHGITGNEFASRTNGGPVVNHRWEHLPRAPSLQGFCTSRTSELGAGADWFIGGFDLADDDDCTDRNRGLVSDLLVPTLYERLHRVGLRTCVIHNFIHGANEPWTPVGMDQWWHLSNSEMRTIKDICSGEDVDQYEPFDAAAWVKAHALLRFRPSTVTARDPRQVLRPKKRRKRREEDDDFISIRGLRADRLAPRLDGTFPDDNVRGERHSGGPPDLTTIYLASIDKGSHVGGLANQETYLAWFDNRLAEFISDYRRLYPRDFNNTVFALVADHGHQDLVPSESITTEVELALLAVILGIDRDELSGIHVIVRKALLADRVAVFGQGMNLNVHLGTPGPVDAGGEIPSALEAARLLLDRPLAVTPYAALVKDDGRYRLLPRGERDLIDVDSARARELITAHLAAPPPDEADLAATAVRSGSLDIERRLRERLEADPFDVLQVEALVDGLLPASGSDVDRSPDVVLLAPNREAFSGNASTHGSFAYPLLRVPMVFCGPAVRGDGEVASADMVDFTPTILSLLGVDQPEDVEGRPRLGYYGRPLRRVSVGTVGSVVTTTITLGLHDPEPAREREMLRLVEAPDEAQADVGGGEYLDLVAVTLQAGTGHRGMSRSGWKRHRVRGGGNVTGVQIMQVDLELPHVPEWLDAAVAGAEEAVGIVLEHADGTQEVLFHASDFCDLAALLADRIATAAIASANEAVGALLDGAEADSADEELASAWAEVGEVQAGDAAALSQAVHAAATAGATCDDAAVHETLTTVAQLVAPPAGGNRVEEACATIERLLRAPQVASLVGLRWS